MDQHSPNYDLVRGFYNAELWKISWVHDAVGKWVTADEFLEITGKEYKKA